MVNTARTVIVTGGSQGIGAGTVKAFLNRDYNVVATSRNITKSEDLTPPAKLALVDGDIGDVTTASRWQKLPSTHSVRSMH
jgi:NAD(P)-dependent dehydrogenase (short-subunit alcohol dehydrogenase family)